MEKRLKRLIIDECANHARSQNEIKDYCLLEEYEGKRCCYMITNECACNYFEATVLPLDKTLHAYYMEQARPTKNHDESTPKTR